MNAPDPTPSTPRRVRATPIVISTCFLVATLTGARAAEPAAPVPSAPPAAPPAATGAAAAKPAAPAKGETHPPRALHTVAPKHPEALRQKLIGGECEIECVVGLDGRVVYTKVVSATHPEFGPEAETALRQWEFQPAMRDGQPVAMTVRVPFSFTFTTDQVLEIVARRKVFQEVTETIIPAEQLPVWPKPTQIFLPPYPSELKGSGKRGKAVVSIIIDKEGHVINPKIVKATYPEFVLPALATVVKLVFAPQQVGGQSAGAIYVSMDIQYDFSDVARPAPAVSVVKPAPEPKKSKPD